MCTMEKNIICAPDTMAPRTTIIGEKIIRHGRSVSGPDAWSTFSEETNWQNIPNKVPEVKNYTGWDHMHCDPDLGLPQDKKEKQ
uniref:hypothetical protein n=1 Tax=Citrobacter farmeri TaxID=67824 RepID=UPI00388F6891